MLARPNDITKFIEVEITKIREDYKRNLTIVIEEPAGSEDPNTYPFYIVMYTMNREEGLNRHPLCWIGDKDLSFPGDFSLQESLQGSFTFFNEAMRIFDGILHSIMKQFLIENSDAVILPPLDQLHLINSKVQYLKILQERGFISSDTQVLFPIDDSGNQINFQDEKHFTELQGYLTELRSITQNTYDPKKKKTAWKGNKCVLKLPYAGASGCVIYPNVVYNEHVNSYIYWLAVYLWAVVYTGESDPQHTRHLRCLGFTRGIIIDRYNPLISIIGEFRTFVANGDIIGISYSAEKVDKALRRSVIKIIPLLFNQRTVAGDVNAHYNPVALDLLKEAFLESPAMKSHWREELSNEDNFKKLFLNQIKEESKEINGLLQLNCNRFDFCVSHETLTGGTFKLMINEVEDITYGTASLMGFMFTPPPGAKSINMKYEQFRHLATRYPDKVTALKENQTSGIVDVSVEVQAAPETEPASKMNVSVEVQAPEIEPAEDAFGGGSRKTKRKRRKTKRRKSKKNKYKKRRSRRRKTKRRKIYR